MGAAVAHFPDPKRIFMTTDAVGGVWTYALELAGALGACEIEVALAVLGPRPSPAQMIAAERIPRCRVFHHGGALEWMDNPWADVDAAGTRLQDLAASFEPDVVHLNDYSHAARRWPCPVVVVAHSCVLTWWRAVKGEEAPARYEEYRRRARAGLQAADLVVSPTAAFRRQLAQEHDARLRAATIPNARSAALFTSMPKELRVLSAGRLWDEGKNLRLLNRIAPRVGMEIALAGEAEQPNVRPFSGRSLRQLGQLDQPQLARELGRAAIYAAPALYEPFGLAILEAALAGCALVLSDLPTLRENWEGCARFVPPDDDEAWIRALNELSENDAERAWLQSCARARALTFTPERQAQSCLAQYRTLLGRRAISAARPAFA